MTVKEVEAAAKKLSPGERAKLLENLIADLDPGTDEGCEAAWIAESKRRYKAFKRGEMKARSADAVLRSIRAKLR